MRRDVGDAVCVLCWGTKHEGYAWSRVGELSGVVAVEDLYSKRTKPGGGTENRYMLGFDEIHMKGDSENYVQEVSDI